MKYLFAVLIALTIALQLVNSLNASKLSLAAQVLTPTPRGGGQSIYINLAYSAPWGECRAPVMTLRT